MAQNTPWIQLQNPNVKSTTERVLEWVPVTGTLITGKDAAIYFKDGKWTAGAIMTIATLISGVGDILTFTGVGKVAGAVGRKALVESAEKVAEKGAMLTAEKVSETATKFAEVRVIQEIVNKGGNISKEGIEEVAKKSVKKIEMAEAVRELNLLSEGAGKNIIANTAKVGDEVGKRVKLKVKNPRIKKQMYAMAEDERSEFLKKLTSEEWKNVTGRAAPIAPIVERKGIEETVKVGTETVKKKASKIKNAIKEFSEAESWVANIYRSGKEVSAGEPLMKQMLIWTGHAPAFLPSTVVDGGRLLTKGFGKGTGTIFNKVMEKPIYAGSAFIAREIGGGTAIYVGNRTPKNDPKPVDKVTQLPKAFDNKVEQPAAFESGNQPTVKPAGVPTPVQDQRAVQAAPVQTAKFTEALSKAVGRKDIGRNIQQLKGMAEGDLNRIPEFKSLAQDDKDAATIARMATMKNGFYRKQMEKIFGDVVDDAVQRSAQALAK